MALLTLSVETPPERGPRRLDQFLQDELPQFSRSRIQQWIKEGHVRVDGATRKPSFALTGGESIVVEPVAAPPLAARPEDIAISVLYEDEDVLAIDKPAGMVVHAGAGNHDGTLVNAVLHRFEELSRLGGDERPGIVHRLDKDTSGVILIARTDAAHRALAAQFASREIKKEYLALVDGSPPADSGRIEKPIARDPIRRTRMTARTGHGRAALTEWRILRRYARHTNLSVHIGTGRTHQIRVHLSSIGHPVTGDALYGATPQKSLDRFFLHAHSITFRSPSRNEPVTVLSPLAPELAEFLRGLE